MELPGKYRVIGLFLAAGFFAGGNARGQALEWQFFDRMATFTNLQGQEVRNASLIRADASQIIYKTNDIYGTVKLTNLAPATLDFLGVPAFPLPGTGARAETATGRGRRQQRHFGSRSRRS